MALTHICHSTIIIIVLKVGHVYEVQEREKKRERHKTERRKGKIEKRNAVGKQQHDAMRKKVEIQQRDIQTIMYVAMGARGKDPHITWSSHTMPCTASLSNDTIDFSCSRTLGKLTAYQRSRLQTPRPISPLLS